MVDMIMDKAALLSLVSETRKRAEGGDLDIASQHEIVTALEHQGVDSTIARQLLAKLIAAQDVELAEMERLLDMLDKG